MIYNTGHRFLNITKPISDRDIWDCPEFFACSYDEIVNHEKCTPALREALDQFPWSGRPNVIQVRPSSWFHGRPSNLLGDGWHIDVNVRLADGRERSAKTMDDWRLMLCSWGNMCETDFMSKPLDLPPALPFETDYGKFFSEVSQLEPLPFVTSAPNQIVEYTSRDMHRVGIRHRSGGSRLMIVAFETDDVIAKGMYFPSMRDRHEKGLAGPEGFIR